MEVTEGNKEQARMHEKMANVNVDSEKSVKKLVRERWTDVAEEYEDEGAEEALESWCMSMREV